MISQPVSASGTIIYVDLNVLVGADDGSSWANAFDTIQKGLDSATSGDEIWVAKGTYNPSAHPNGGSSDREMHFSLINEVEVYGGFGGTEVYREERNWKDNATILSGDIGISGNSADNCYHVFFHPGGINLDATAILDGFTITTGKAGGSANHSHGGGMYNDRSSPTIVNCTFSNNSAGISGGAIANLLSSPRLINCNFSGNSALSYGGGMYNFQQCSPNLNNCSFSGNSAGTGGGGMWSYNSSPMLINCNFTGNAATLFGGGMLNWRFSSPELINCSFSGNLAYDGGGIYNNISSSPTLTNCILWGNSAVNSCNEVFSFNSSPAFSYCDVKGSGGSTNWDSNLGADAGSNIDADPLFINEPNPGNAPTTVGDIHLQIDSYCIDSGNNTAVVGVSTDFEGDPRIIDGDRDNTNIVDIGADEFLKPTSPYPIESVGGEALLINSISVIAPWLGFLTVSIVGSIIALRRRKV